MANSFTPEQIEQFLQEFFTVVGRRQYIGARYVPIFGRKDESSIEWDNTKSYDPLTIVLYQGNSYTSRTYVPTGIAITDTTYWVNTGNYNAQIEQYRQEVLAFNDRITANENNIDALNGILPKSSFSPADTVKKYIDDADTQLQSNIDARTLVFDSVNEMKTSDKTYLGAICKTLGFHRPDDFGGAYYIVTDDDTPNEMDVISLENSLYAKLHIVSDYVTPQMYGAFCDGETDDSAFIQKAIDSQVKVTFPKGSYLIDDTIDVTKFHKRYYTVNGEDAYIKYTGTSYAFTFSNLIYSTIRFGCIHAPNGSCILLNTSSGWCQYDDFYIHNLGAADDAFTIKIEDSGSWVNQINLWHCHLIGTNGFRIVNELGEDFNHYNLYSCGFEQVTNGVKVENNGNGSINEITIIACRMKENVTKLIHARGTVTNINALLSTTRTPTQVSSMLDVDTNCTDWTLRLSEKGAMIVVTDGIVTFVGYGGLISSTDDILSNGFNNISDGYHLFDTNQTASDQPNNFYSGIVIQKTLIQSHSIKIQICIYETTRSIAIRLRWWGTWTSWSYIAAS